jgi:hypothetical protein
LPPTTRILPTHGAGSFAAPVRRPSRTTSIRSELARNPVLAAMAGGDFRDALLGSLGRFPAYYAHMAPLNRAGPGVLGALPETPTLDVGGLAAVAQAGVAIVDGRPRAAFAAAHIPAC